MKRKNKIKKRDINLLLIYKKEINCRPKTITNKKVYSRKTKHKKNYYLEY